jgi:putative endonuclease
VKAKALGYSGETLAAQYLQTQGYQILENNFTIRGGEIDLIARKENIIIFIEVKTRTGKSFGEADESLNGFKKMRLRRAIEHYLAKIRGTDPDYRVDFIEIELDPETKKLTRINHLQDIEI